MIHFNVWKNYLELSGLDVVWCGYLLNIFAVLETIAIYQNEWHGLLPNWIS